jgi:hypothetical protein
LPPLHFRVVESYNGGSDGYANSCRVFADLVVIFISRYLPSFFFLLNTTENRYGGFAEKENHISGNLGKPLPGVEAGTLGIIGRTKAGIAGIAVRRAQGAPVL